MCQTLYKQKRNKTQSLLAKSSIYLGISEAPEGVKLSALVILPTNKEH